MALEHPERVTSSRSTTRGSTRSSSRPSSSGRARPAWARRSSRSTTTSAPTSACRRVLRQGALRHRAARRGRGAGARTARHARRGPRCGPREALRRAAGALPHDHSADAAPLGPRGPRDHLTYGERLSRDLPTRSSSPTRVRPLPDDRGGRAVERASSRAFLARASREVARAHALFAIAAYARRERSRAATGFTDIGQDIVPRDSPRLRGGGDLRLRAEASPISTSIAGPTPSGQLLYPGLALRTRTASAHVRGHAPPHRPRRVRAGRRWSR